MPRNFHPSEHNSIKQKLQQSHNKGQDYNNNERHGAPQPPVPKRKEGSAGNAPAHVVFNNKSMKRFAEARTRTHGTRARARTHEHHTPHTAHTTHLRTRSTRT